MSRGRPDRRPVDLAVTSLAAGIISLAVMPLAPIVPGWGSLLALALGLVAFRRGERRWIAAAGIGAGVCGLALVLVQLVAVVIATLEAGL